MWLTSAFEIVVGQNSQRSAVEIIVLAALERPQKGNQPREAEEQRQRDKVNKDIHGLTSSYAQQSNANGSSVS
jgi:hypothetical protein